MLLNYQYLIIEYNHYMKLENVVIRPYQLTDYNSVKQNLIEAEMYYEEIYSEKRLQAKIKRDSKSILVAEIEGKVVGNIFFDIDWFPLIFGLAVRSDYRNKGIGRKLVETIVIEAKNKGYKSIDLLVRENRTELQNTYAHWGFVKGNVYRWMSREIKITR